MSDESWAQHMKREHDWLQNLKEGDVVACSMGWGVYGTSKVSKATRTLIFVAGIRYARKDGRKVPRHSWDSSSICELTEEIAADIEERRLRRRIEDVDWKKQSVGCIKRVLDLVAADQSDAEIRIRLVGKE